MGLDFKQLRAANDERAAIWDPDGVLNVEFASIELAGEVGEALNKIKKYIRWHKNLPGGECDLCAIMDELGDVVICADLLARALGQDLGSAVGNKFNKTSKKHGFATMLKWSDNND